MGMGKKKARRRWPVILCAVLAVLLVLGVIWREPIRVIYHSNFEPLKKVDLSAEWTGGTTYKNVQYSDVSETDYLNLYVPAGEGAAPLFVMVHGGGFVSNDCESRQAQLMYHYFRDHGYACATINYRLAQEARFPAAVQDVKAAVRYLKANADTYGYDAGNVVIWGESAGGYLAMMAGVTGDDAFNDLPFIGEDALDAPVSAEVRAIVDFYGVMRLESSAAREAAFRELGIPAIVVKVGSTWLSSALKDYPGYDTIEDFWLDRDISAVADPEAEDYSPAYYVKRNLPGRENLDVLILHGDADITVPWTQSRGIYERLCEALGEEKVTIKYIHNAKHASEKLYSDEELAGVDAWIRGILGDN